MNRLEPEACLIPQEDRVKLRAALPSLWVLPFKRGDHRRFFRLVALIEKNPDWCQDLTSEELPSGEYVKLHHEARRNGSHWSDYWWLHGGIRGRKPGEYLLPASVTGQDPRQEGNSFPRRKDFVFICRNDVFANLYACHQSDGVIYEVAPDNPIRPQPSHLRALMILWEDPKLAHVPGSILIEMLEGFTCSRAKVIATRERSLPWYHDDQAGRPRRHD
ncbi:hypothetical protein [Pseudotabrizicola algicola]|uniref:Uncharacterized protein n=1 Tax=Pseudotabrizicola algicola TaxID=2709381 RepID=A0A6B3RNU5_9RHOB|nr:hypothetical protein [Pseudotabrizicola algicola]NEX47740.1 hypothetical protein [Pseudotabrizicola algicola]